MTKLRFSLVGGTLVAIWLIAIGSRIEGQGPQPVSVVGTVTTSAILNSDVRQSTAGNLNAQVVGTVAEDGPIAGNPVQVAGRASSSVPTSVSTNNDVVRPWYTLFGAQNVVLRDGNGVSAMDNTNNAARVNVVAGANVDIAQGTAITTQPGPIVMAEASTLPPTAVTAQQVRRLWTNLNGALVTVTDLCGNPALVSSTAISTSASGNTSLVALAASQIVYVCGFQVFAGGTTNVSLVTGTGTACATGETALTGAYPFIAQTGIALANGGAVQVKGAPSSAVCIKNSAAVAIAGMLTYVQR